MRSVLLSASAFVLAGLALATFDARRLWASQPMAVQPVAVVGTGLTHLGVHTADLVTLEADLPIGGAPTAAFQRRFLDGTASSDTNGFAVPAGMVLVVTDVDFRFRDADPDASASFTLTPRNGPNNAGGFASITSARADAAGSGGGSATMTAGFAVAAGRNLLANISPASASIQGAVVRGYLKPQ